MNKGSHHKGPNRESESSRILKRRLRESQAGRGFSPWSENHARSAADLDAFFVEQRQRVARVADRSVDRVRNARQRLQREDERATRYEAVVGFDVQVRGACGSDVHIRWGMARVIGIAD